MKTTIKKLGGARFTMLAEFDAEELGYMYAKHSRALEEVKAVICSLDVVPTDMLRDLYSGDFVSSICDELKIDRPLTLEEKDDEVFRSKIRATMEKFRDLHQEHVDKMGAIIQLINQEENN